MSWQSDVDQLLYAGETVLAKVAGHEAAIAVTSHRVLVFTPGVEGPNVQTFHRPNVTGLSKRASGSGRWLRAGAKWLVLGVALTIVGSLIDLEGVLGNVSTEGTAGEVDVGWIGGLFDLFSTVFALLDDVLLLGGILSSIAGLVFVAGYLKSRASVVTIEVAGEGDVDLPAAGFSDSDVGKLADAIDPTVAVDSKPSSR
ncbi:MAG: hypothetical protein U5K70_03520 [Halodesulfurarchaeum sp.]|nr:hypothetical protein [Halodesulfurarchaeum sp.]